MMRITLMVTVIDDEWMDIAEIEWQVLVSPQTVNALVL